MLYASKCNNLPLHKDSTVQFHQALHLSGTTCFAQNNLQICLFTYFHLSPHYHYCLFKLFKNVPSSGNKFPWATLYLVQWLHFQKLTWHDRSVRDSPTCASMLYTNERYFFIRSLTSCEHVYNFSVVTMFWCDFRISNCCYRVSKSN